MINCKVELNFRWTKQFALSVDGTDNANDNDYYFFFTIKDTKLYVPVVALSARDDKKLSKFLSKDLMSSVLE